MPRYVVCRFLFVFQILLFPKIVGRFQKKSKVNITQKYSKIQYFSHHSMIPHTSTFPSLPIPLYLCDFCLPRLRTIYERFCASAREAAAFARAASAFCWILSLLPPLLALALALTLVPALASKSASFYFISGCNKISSIVQQHDVLCSATRGRFQKHMKFADVLEFPEILNLKSEIRNIFSASRSARSGSSPAHSSRAPWMVPTGMHSSSPRVGGVA